MIHDDYPHEPCDECGELCVRLISERVTLGAMTTSGDMHTLTLVCMADAARRVHGGAAGRDLAGYYESAAAVTRAIQRAIVRRLGPAALKKECDS